MLNKKNIYIGLFIVALMGLQYWFGPKRVITKTEVKTKLVEVIKRDIEIIERKDGSKVTRIKERQDRQVDKHKRSSREVIPVKKDWLVGISRSLTSDEYTGQVYRRVLFDLHVGLYATTNKEIGFGLI